MNGERDVHAQTAHQGGAGNARGVCINNKRYVCKFEGFTGINTKTVSINKCEEVSCERVS